MVPDERGCSGSQADSLMGASPHHSPATGKPHSHGLARGHTLRRGVDGIAERSVGLEADGRTAGSLFVITYVCVGTFLVVIWLLLLGTLERISEPISVV